MRPLEPLLVSKGALPLTPGSGARRPSPLLLPPPSLRLPAPHLLSTPTTELPPPLQNPLSFQSSPGWASPRSARWLATTPRVSSVSGASPSGRPGCPSSPPRRPEWPRGRRTGSSDWCDEKRLRPSLPPSPRRPSTRSLSPSLFCAEPHRGAVPHPQVAGHLPLARAPAAAPPPAPGAAAGRGGGSAPGGGQVPPQRARHGAGAEGVLCGDSLSGVGERERESRRAIRPLPPGGKRAPADLSSLNRSPHALSRPADPSTRLPAFLLSSLFSLLFPFSQLENAVQLASCSPDAASYASHGLMPLPHPAALAKQQNMELFKAYQAAVKARRPQKGGRKGRRAGSYLLFSPLARLSPS